MQVLNSIRVNGPKLVEMPPEAELSLRLTVPGLKIVPEVFYHRQWQRSRTHHGPAAATAKRNKAGPGAAMLTANTVTATPGAQISVTDRVDGKPVQGAQIVAFTNFAARQGAQATTGADGRAVLSGIAPGRALERLYVYPPANY